MSLSPGTPVRSIDNPSREGVVTNARPRVRPSGVAYQVRWADGLSDFVREDELEPLENLDKNDPFSVVERGLYGRATDLRRNLTYTHLAGRLANLVYSMGITDTDFYPHQYRPLLTLLDSPANGLLIADEVGLGKTIEAGLIWTEFRARLDMRRLVIICPAMLREKWRDELRNRFGVDARIVDAKEFLDEISLDSHPSEGRAWVLSYQAARPPRDWAANAKTPERPNARWKLADYLHSKAQDEPIIDMVVFDEAHYMRNTETASWQLADLLREVTSFQVMLSATPINLRNEDLFNLLKLLDPDHFSSPEDFRRMLEANRPLVAARDAVLNKSNGLDIVKARLSDAALMFHDSLQMKAIMADPPTEERLRQDAYRAELADALERMNLLGHAVTRTRKRDIHLRRILRQVKREAVPMNDLERQLYEKVTETTREYAWREGISDGFLLAMPQRQVTSCPAAVARVWTEHGGSLEQALDDVLRDLDDEGEDIPRAPLRNILASAVNKNFDVDALEQNDSKFARLLAVSGDYLSAHPAEKIIVFTTFRATAAYLKRRLEAESFPSMILWGGESAAKQELIDQFRESKTLRFLISTEVAAEGVDLQFCRVLVNYDLPWNPTRIEQRIGRIDRLGQQSELIHIWNLYFANSIDERVVVRLFDRLRIFEEALGESEAVVGEEVRRLESELLRRPLTPEEEEAQIAQTAQALENIRVQREELEKNAAHMMAHGHRVMERAESAHELSRRVTEPDLLAYVTDYLERFSVGHRFHQLGDDPYRVEIQLPMTLANRLDEYVNAEKLTGKTALASGQPRKCRFRNRISERPKPGEEIIHQFHPFIRFISHDLRDRDEHFYPVVAVHLSNAEESPLGTYVFYTRSWLFHGVREEEILSTVVMDVESGEGLAEDLGDALLQRARLSGSDWLAAHAEVQPGRVCGHFEQAEEVLDRRFQEVLARKRNENSDRARFQVEAVDRHLDRRLPTLRTTLHAHIASGRTSLAKATQGQIDKLQARMTARKDRIMQAENITANKNFVCAGLIKVS